jgi:hypothetical protein
MEYVQTIGSLPPDSDYSIVLWKGFLTPLSRLATTDWADNYPTGLPGEPPSNSGNTFHDEMTNFHEFGHTIRQSEDGDYNHFINDVVTYRYGHGHDFCHRDNQGFAFNEGWAEYWSKQPQFPRLSSCHASSYEMDVEGVVATDLDFLEKCTHVGRKGMFSVLQEGSNIVHSDADFRNRFRQRFSWIDLSGCVNIVRALPRRNSTTIVPQQAMLSLTPPNGVTSTRFLDRLRTFLLSLLHKDEQINMQRQIDALDSDLAAQKQVTNQLRVELDKALKIAAMAGTCPSTPCDVVAERILKPAIVRGEIEISEQLENELESDLSSTKRGERLYPFLTLETERRARALKFDSGAKEIVLRTLREASTAISALAAQDKSGALAAQSEQLQRQAKLLQLRSTADDISLTFLKLPRSPRDDIAGTAVLHPYIGFLARGYRIVWLFFLACLLFLIASMFIWRAARERT